jgi:hypothetical protein
MKTITLYRPVGQLELDLIKALDFRAFPPRLEWQPIFYPVLDKDYACQIAREWNTKDEANGNVGYVTRFEVDKAYADQFAATFSIKLIFLLGQRFDEERV